MDYVGTWRLLVSTWTFHRVFFGGLLLVETFIAEPKKELHWKVRVGLVGMQGLCHLGSKLARSTADS